MKTFFLLVLFSIATSELYAEPQVYLTFREVEFDPDEIKIDYKKLIPVQQWNEIEPELADMARVISREELIRELSKSPTPDAIAHFSSTHPAGILILTDRQFQVLARMLNQERSVDLLSLPSATVNSGDAALIQIAGIRRAAIPTISDDGASIELEFFLPRDGFPLASKQQDIRPSVHITIPDGTNLICFETGRLAFIKAQLMDPSTMEKVEPEPFLHHIVQVNETVEELAQFYRIEQDDILKENNLASPTLETGKPVRIPLPQMDAESIFSVFKNLDKRDYLERYLAPEK